MNDKAAEKIKELEVMIGDSKRRIEGLEAKPVYN
jgi:hypothetical protein